MEYRQRYKYPFVVSCLMLVSGAALGIVRHLAFDFIFILGGVGYGLYYMLMPTEGLDLRLRRLVRMNVFASLLFILSGVARLGLFDSYGHQLWVVFLLMGVIFMAYASIIPNIGRKK